MTEPRAGHRAGVPKATGPLWVISLFLGLSEVVVAVATTQAHGWIQGMLAIFSVAFPTLVTAAFFLILWNDNKVLYAPHEFGNSEMVESYTAAMSRDTRRNGQLVVSAIETIATRLEKLTETSDAGPAQRERIIASVTAAASRALVTVDLQALGGTDFAMPVDEKTTVKDFLDVTYYAITPAAKPFSYGNEWVLRDDTAEKVHDDIGTWWAAKNLGARDDYRRLVEVGITGGARLRAVRP